MNNAENSVLATYYVQTEQPLELVAEHFAYHETTGYWQAQSEPTELFSQCVGSVHEVRDLGGGEAEISIYLPLKNLNLEEAPYESVNMALTSGYAPAWLPLTKSRLVDFQLPESVLPYYAGPKFGIDGIRRLLNAGEHELIVGTIVKPVAGLTPAEVAADVYEGVLGGVRFIKDDQKMLNPVYCPLAERVERVMEAVHKAEAQTGNTALYAPNITSRPDHILENAHIALERGARALMVNYVIPGIWAVEMLARDPEIDVPIYVHCGGKEYLTRDPGQGIDPVVLTKFVRLAGGDMLRLSAVGGDLVHSDPETVAEMHAAMTEPWGPVGPVMPAASGGLKPGNLHQTLEVCGTDLMVLAGRGIASHPMGVKAGTLAFQQAADAFLAGVPVAEYAQDHEELRLALS